MLDLTRLRATISAVPTAPADHRSENGPALVAALAALAAILCLFVWAFTGGPFWPAWVWQGLLLVTAIVVLVQRVRARPMDPLRLHGWIASIVLADVLSTWALGDAGYFWPAWVLLGLAATLGLHAVVRLRDELPGAERERRLSARVDSLERTRRGALDVQAAELRRIERDLHDGAQARLVALTMRLGRAETRLEEHPEAAALVREAREEAGAAIAELRDLARGIAPPVLADRGLAAAAQALADRAPLPVSLEAELPRRPPPSVEAAGYFVVSETLTNVAKHAPGASATVLLREASGGLRVVIADDGPGGAVATGSGLTGLRQRVDALDGSLTLVSPPGGGTRIEVELPCAW